MLRRVAGAPDMHAELIDLWIVVSGEGRCWWAGQSRTRKMSSGRDEHRH
jgi:hypothetical protein